MRDSRRFQVASAFWRAASKCNLPMASRLARAPVLVHGGDGHAGFQLLGLAELEAQQQARRLVALARRQHGLLGDRLAEAHDEARLPLHPVLGVHGAGDLAARGVHRVLALRDARPIAKQDAVLQVHQHLHAAGLGKGVALEGHALGGGEVDAHAQVFERDGVVAGAGALARLVVGAAEVGGLGCPALALRGLQQHVAQVADAHAAHVRVRKAQDAWRPVLVAAAEAPAAVGVVGAGEHHAEGHRGAGRDVAGAVGADEGVDVAGKALRLHAARQQHHGGDEDAHVHRPSKKVKGS